jgi:1-acyl-sn-glycerol-3-phosphate acyltransferase
MTFIRSALFNLWFYLFTAVCSIFGALIGLVSLPALKCTEHFWARINLLALRLICGIKVKVIGRENLPEGPALIASQHQSAFDTFVWLNLIPRGSYVLKQELCRIPVFGQLLPKLGHIPVDRDAGASALRSLLKDGAAALDRGSQLVIFPEGTRVAAGQRGELQPGVAALAMSTGAAVVPVATDSGYCWGRNAFVKRAGTIHLVIQPPLPQGLRRPAMMTALQESWDQGQEIIHKACG